MSQENDYFPCYDEDDEPEQEYCDYGFGDECVGDKLFCMECWLFQEADRIVRAKALGIPSWDIHNLWTLFEEGGSR